MVVSKNPRFLSGGFLRGTINNLKAVESQESTPAAWLNYLW
jgi:hypothetical protein